jgi:CubicO group peptidase (beta-lactamase class C family)
MPDNIPNVIDALCEAVHDSIIRKEEIDKRCYKIIQAKYWAGLNKSVFVTKDHLTEDLHTPGMILQQQKLCESSITLLKNENDMIPVKNLEKLKIASLVIGYKDKGVFQETMDLYADVKHFYIDRASTYHQFDSVARLLKDYNLIIAAIVNTDIRANKNFGINDSCFFIFDSLARKHNVILDLFCDPYALEKIKNPYLYKAIILSYEDKDMIQNFSAQLIFGGIPAKGILPVTASEQFCLGNGIIQKSSTRLKYTIPEETGISSSSLNCIDSLVSDAIVKQAFPGCQILIAKEGKVIYCKSFGFHTYDRTQPVRNSDIYDLASITKIAATTPAIMKLSEQNKMKLNKSLSSYLPGSSRSNKGKLAIFDLLQHQSGMASFIPFYMSTITPVNADEKLTNKTASVTYTIKSVDNYYFNKNIKYIEGYYSHEPYNYFTTQVADSLYILKSYTDTILNKIYASPLQVTKRKQSPEYKYSDLGFILLGKAVEKVSKQTLDQYMDSVFYKPLGATTLSFLPRKKFKKECIVPTENDVIFRKQIIQGYVHDPACAMMGGVSGHAGLFSNANDLAKLMQMFLNKGTYGGTRFLNTSTVENFTSRQTKFANNRRGLGFDKPETDTTKQSPSGYLAPPSSYGHSGFTGTFVWVDPDNQIIYIFLSNRVYPDQSNNKIVEMNVRTRIQDIIYQSIK